MLQKHPNLGIFQDRNPKLGWQRPCSFNSKWQQNTAAALLLGLCGHEATEHYHRNRMIERSLTLYDYTLHFPNHALMGKYRQPRRFILYLIDMLCLAVERPTQGPGALLVVGQITN